MLNKAKVRAFSISRALVRIFDRNEAVQAGNIAGVEEQRVVELCGRANGADGTSTFFDFVHVCGVGRTGESIRPIRVAIGWTGIEGRGVRERERNHFAERVSCAR